MTSYPSPFSSFLLIYHPLLVSLVFVPSPPPWPISVPNPVLSFPSSSIFFFLLASCPEWRCGTAVVRSRGRPEVKLGDSTPVFQLVGKWPYAVKYQITGSRPTKGTGDQKSLAQS